MTTPSPSTDGTPSRPGAQSALDAETSFLRLYDETSSRVYGLVLRVVRSPMLAEQVAREVYLRAWADADREEGTLTTVVARLMVAAHRHAVDSVRLAETTPSPDSEPVAAGPVPEVPGVESAASVTANAALDRLPAAQREAVDLAYGGGYTHAEVARLLGVGSAHELLLDGLRLLRTALATPA